MTMKNKKVAFCISGETRTFNLCYPYIKKNLLDPIGKNKTDYDIFCCIENDRDFIKIKKMDPTKIIKIKNKDFKKEYKDIFKNLYKKFFAYGNINNHLNQVNKINLCNQLRKKYQKENKIKYNWICRFRFDLLPINKINYSALKKEYLYVPKSKPSKIPICNDMIAISNEELMDIYCNLKNKFRKVLNDFYSEEFNTTLRISLSIEKYYLWFLELLIKYSKKQGFFSKIFNKMILLRGNLFLRPPLKNIYTIEHALLRYLKEEKVNIKNLEIDYILVREKWSSSGVLLNKQ
jgi:hypothetical protein